MTATETATTTTTTAAENDPQLSREVADIIRGQIELGIFWSLGAHNLRHGFVDNKPALIFTARILPFTKAGHRSSQARTMQVTIALSRKDYYDVRVTYAARGTGEQVTHFERDDVDAFTLPRLLLALDHDGAEVMNPRYAS